MSHHAPTHSPYRRAGSGHAGPAERRRRAQRVFALMSVLALVGGILYANSVLNDQDGAAALSGVLDAGDDNAATDINTAVTVDIDENDTGDIDVTSYTITDGPDHGVLGALNPVTGEVEYTPDTNWVGTDQFSYTVEETVGTYFDASLLNTGRDGAGAIADGATDPNWRTSASLGGTQTAATGQAAAGGWATTTATSNWICGVDCSAARDAAVYFHRDFQIVDQSTADHLVLALDVFADDEVFDIYVNGISTGISKRTWSYGDGRQLNAVLDPADGAFTWVVGTNTITIHAVNTGAGPMGLLVKPSTGDEDGDGVADTADRCWGTPDGVSVTGEGCRIETGTASVAVTNPAAVGCGRTVNGSFELPDVGGKWKGKPASKVPGWDADPAHMEFWNAGFLGNVPVDGTQIAELNARAPGTIYQDIPTNGGEELTWSVWHRGRRGVETIEVFVGPPVDLGPGLTSMGQFSTDKTFTNYQGAYTVPAGQGVTRIVIKSVYPSTGSLGNLVDAVSLEPTGCPLLGVAAPTTTTTVAPTTTTVPATTTTTTPTTTTVPATTTTVPATTTTVPATTTTVPATTTTVAPTTTTVPATTTTTTVATGGDLGGGQDSDGDGIPDELDPTPIIDVTVEFLTIDREEIGGADLATYRLRVTNNGPDIADATLVSFDPSAGTLVSDWEFGSWEALAEVASPEASLFAGALAATPDCWLDATVLRCELGAVSAGWGIEFDVTVEVLDDQPLAAEASVTAIGFDIDLDNNVDAVEVHAAISPAVAAIPTANLAFTGVRFGMLWWIAGAAVLIGGGGGMMMLGAGRRRDDEAYG